jgi:hypothetical protein
MVSNQRKDFELKIKVRMEVIVKCTFAEWTLYSAEKFRSGSVHLALFIVIRLLENGEPFYIIL